MEKSEIVNDIMAKMAGKLSDDQAEFLKASIIVSLRNVEIVPMETSVAVVDDNNEWIIKRFVVDMIAGNRKQSTVRHYVGVVNRFLNDTGMYYKNTTAQDVTDYIAIRKVTPSASTGKPTSHNYLVGISKALRIFYEWAYKKHHIDEDISRDIEILKQKQKRKERLSNDEVEQIRESLDDVRDKALFELMMSTGIRVGEIEGLMIEDINFQTMEIHVRGYKTDEADRTCVMSIKARNAIKKYICNRKTGNLFLSQRGGGLSKSAIEKRSKSFGERIDCKIPTTVHVFRKTYASELYRKTKNVKAVSMILGHANTAVTEKYYIVDDTAEMLNIVRGA